MEANSRIVTEMSASYFITRCGCDDPMSHAILQLPCPTPRLVEAPVTQRWVAPKE